MIMREKFKKCHNTNSKFDFIPWNSNIDYNIYRTFNAFPLNLHPIKNPHRSPTGPTGPWGFITLPIPIPYPYPWESPWESPYPRQPWRLTSLAPSGSIVSVDSSWSIVHNWCLFAVHKRQSRDRQLFTLCQLISVFSALEVCYDDSVLL